MQRPHRFVVLLDAAARGGEPPQRHADQRAAAPVSAGQQLVDPLQQRRPHARCSQNGQPYAGARGRECTSGRMCVWAFAGSGAGKRAFGR